MTSSSLSIIALLLLSASLFAAGASAQSGDSGALANPLQAQSLDRLSATRDRPLFSPSRRPVPPPPPPVVHVPEPAPPPPPPSVTLVGIVLDGEGARAIVRTGMGKKFERVQIGDDIGGWKVSQIEGRKLVLSLGERLATFTLFSDERGKRPPEESASTAAGQQPTAPQQDHAQQTATQQRESQPTSPRKRRKQRE